MEFHRRHQPAESTLVLFPGAFNPPTRAHLAMAHLALRQGAEEVVFVLPRKFPHKDYDGPGFEDRVRLLLEVSSGERRFSVASTAGGLLIDIARDVRACGELQERILFLCGSDAARRFLDWNYGDAIPFERQLQEYELLVAPRDDDFDIPEIYRPRVHLLPLGDEYRGVSSSAYRASGGEPTLLPPQITKMAMGLYLKKP